MYEYSTLQAHYSLNSNILYVHSTLCLMYKMGYMTYAPAIIAQLEVHTLTKSLALILGPKQYLTLNNQPNSNHNLGLNEAKSNCHWSNGQITQDVYLMFILLS